VVPVTFPDDDLPLGRVNGTPGPISFLPHVLIVKIVVAVAVVAIAADRWWRAGRLSSSGVETPLSTFKVDPQRVF